MSNTLANLTITGEDNPVPVTDSGTVLTSSHILTGTGSVKSKLVSIEIKSSTTAISNYCFYAYTNLTTVTFESSPNITTLGDGSFTNCSSLTTITIPNSVTYIGQVAFVNCTGLQNVTIPNSVTEIEYRTFDSCSNLSNIDLGNSITTIGGRAFWECTALTSITIPNSVISIGSSAFYNVGTTATNGVTLNFQADITTIDSNSFTDADIKEINLNSSSRVLGGTTFTGGTDKTILSFFGGGPHINNTDSTKIAVFCYHPNTLILTDKGNVKITDLKRGDLIKTLNGFKPLAKLIKNIHLNTKFVEFPKNCFGENIPNQDLHITTGHPVYFDEEFYLPENFIGMKNIEIVSKDAVYVYHLQFDTHEVVYSNNFTTTSLPHNTDYLNFHLKEEEFIDKTKFNKENIGKMYPPYMLHEEPLFIREIDF